MSGAPRSSLPVRGRAAEFAAALARGNRVVLTAETGTGKTYVYFRDMTGKEKGWKPFLNRLRKKFDVQVEKATWSEFG